MEESFKKGFRTYSNARVNSLVMIVLVNNTLVAVESYFKAKIQYPGKRHLKSSPKSMKIYCQFEQYGKDTCPTYKEEEDKEFTADSRVTFYKD